MLGDTMTDPRASADASEESDETAEGEATAPGMPRWVKVLGAIALVVVVIAVVAMLISGGEHGPGRHGAERAASTAAHCDAAC